MPYGSLAFLPYGAVSIFLDFLSVISIVLLKLFCMHWSKTLNEVFLFLMPSQSFITSRLFCAVIYKQDEQAKSCNFHINS